MTLLIPFVCRLSLFHFFRLIFFFFHRYGLSAELEAKRKAGYPVELENQARQWLEAVVGEPIGADFQAGLKDGVFLCKLANKLRPGSVAKYVVEGTSYRI